MTSSKSSFREESLLQLCIDSYLGYVTLLRVLVQQRDSSLDWPSYGNRASDTTSNDFYILVNSWSPAKNLMENHSQSCDIHGKEYLFWWAARSWSRPSWKLKNSCAESVKLSVYHHPVYSWKLENFFLKPWMNDHPDSVKYCPVRALKSMGCLPKAFVYHSGSLHFCPVCAWMRVELVVNQSASVGIPHNRSAVLILGSRHALSHPKYFSFFPIRVLGVLILLLGFSFSPTRALGEIVFLLHY